MHDTVLLREAVAALVTDDDGYYVDATFGRGGHSRALLERLGPRGRVLAVDRDPAAAAAGAALAAQDARLECVHAAFSALPVLLAERGISAVDGILLDLGVSSPQLDDAGRGFSFRHDGPLDMRMDTTRGATAAEWLRGAAQEEITQVLRDYGEERFARRIAAAIVRARAGAPIDSTGRLAAIVSEANPRWEKHKHPATRAFQAIRIRVNGELDELRALLDGALALLALGGRLVVISFHSLEDRLVKRFMRDLARGETLPAGVPVRDQERRRPLRLVGKAVRPGAADVAANPRARSAIMRTAERVA